MPRTTGGKEKSPAKKSKAIIIIFYQSSVVVSRCSVTVITSITLGSGLGSTLSVVTVFSVCSLRVAPSPELSVVVVSVVTFFRCPFAVFYSE